jgi:P-type Cu2+ transporter
LTTAHPDLLEVVPCASSTVEEVLTLAAAAELRLTHPVADAVVRAAKTKDLSIPERTALDYTLSLGVEAVVDDSVVLVGSPRFMEQRGLTLSRKVRREISRMQRQGISPLGVARDGCIIGLLSISAPLRPEARDVVQALRQRGIKHIAMLTGDHQDVAKRVAAELGITEYEAELFSADKAEAIQRLQRQGYKVAVVGDGINDCPMVAYADVGIAIEGDAVAVRKTAPVVLLNGGIGKVPAAIDIGRETVALIRQNWTITAIPNTIVIGLASVGLLGTIGSSLLSDGSSIIAALNSLRPIMGNGVGEQGGSDVPPNRDPVELLAAPESKRDAVLE